MISHGNYRSMLDMVVEMNVLGGDDDITYLFLPLAHSFALLIQFGSFELGSTIAYWERDPLKIVPNLSEVKPTYFPSVPRIFEKIYTAATSAVEKEGGDEEGDLRLVGRGRQEGPRGSSTRGARLARCSRRSTRSPTGSSSRRSATCSAAGSGRRSAGPRRSTPRSSASSTPPACSCSRAGA